MQDLKRDFIDFAMARQVLRFGEFKLKSGRISPYFFNSGLFSDAEALSRLGQFYADAIERSSIQYDMLFGAAYKGIPLASAMAIALYQRHRKSVPYCFNRKEIKDHGEGGGTFGARLQGKVLIVDDVISAGTSITLCLDLLARAGASPAGAIVALDRRERAPAGSLSARAAVEKAHAIKVVNIIDLHDIIVYLREAGGMDHYIELIDAYRSRYGAEVTPMQPAHS